jgi:hypothetical protein
MVLSASALAQERPPVSVQPLTAESMRADCLRLMQERQAMRPDYQPGVDVNGRPVVPADLPDQGGAQQGLPPNIVIALTRPLSAVAPGAPAAVANSDVSVGQVAIDPLTGRAALNGRALTPPQAPLPAECMPAR